MGLLKSQLKTSALSRPWEVVTCKDSNLYFSVWLKVSKN